MAQHTAPMRSLTRNSSLKSGIMAKTKTTAKPVCISHQCTNSPFINSPCTNNLCTNNLCTNNLCTKSRFIHHTKLLPGKTGINLHRNPTMAKNAAAPWKARHLPMAARAMYLLTAMSLSNNNKPMLW